jgi:hypothetical protein
MNFKKILNIKKISEFFYKSNQGCYVKEDGVWSFIPFEKKISYEELIAIAEALETLSGHPFRSLDKE